MDQRLASASRMSINEKKFIEAALASDLRVDGRRPFDYRRLTIKFGRDGSSEVHLGQTHVMCHVTSQLVEPYRDKLNEGTLSIFTEFSPMADPSFESGRPGEYAVELGRIIDRGLRESRAVDTESLSVLSGKFVWFIRVDLHILDNRGNLVDAANIAALAALLTFRMPDCSLGGEDGQKVIIHPPEVKEPLCLRIHHLPIAISFAFFGDGIVAIDPSHDEEAVMGGRMTMTLNANGDVCAIQKSGGEGVLPSTIMQCLRIASVKASDITNKIKDSVVAYNTERALKKIKRHSSIVAVDFSVPDIKMEDYQCQSTIQRGVGEFSVGHDSLKLKKDESYSGKSHCLGEKTAKSAQNEDTGKGLNVKKCSKAPSTWDTYSKGIDSEALMASLVLSESSGPNKKKNLPKEDEKPSKSKHHESALVSSSSVTASSAPTDVKGPSQKASGVKTLKDAVKPKNKRKKKALSGSDGTSSCII